MKKRRKSGKVTIADVADAVGVSAITVSRVLREPGKVSPAVVAQVQQAVEDLGYVPDPAARALASCRTDVIGVLIPSVTNNVFADVMRGIYSAVENTRFHVQLGNTRYSALEEEKLLRIFLSQNPAGLVVTGIDQTPAARELLEGASCPIVQIMEIGEAPIDMMVGFSHRDAAFAATQHLAQKGYRKLGFIGARMDPRTQRRYEGFREAASQAGVFDQSRVVTTTKTSSVALGCELVSELFSRAPDADAVFCNNDDLALGALFQCQRMLIDVPGKFGICGFNDLEMMAVAHPPLTSVLTYRHDMGARATDMLIKAIEGRREQRIVDLGFRLMPRQSSAKSRRGGG